MPTIMSVTSLRAGSPGVSAPTPKKTFHMERTIVLVLEMQGNAPEAAAPRAQEQGHGLSPPWGAGSPSPAVTGALPLTPFLFRPGLLKTGSCIPGPPTTFWEVSPSSPETRPTAL